MCIYGHIIIHRQIHQLSRAVGGFGDIHFGYHKWVPQNLQNDPNFCSAGPKFWFIFIDIIRDKLSLRQCLRGRATQKLMAKTRAPRQAPQKGWMSNCQIKGPRTFC